MGIRQQLQQEEITPIEYYMGLYQDLITNLDNAVDAGIMDEETAKAHKAQAIIDLNEKLLDEEGIDEEDLEEVYGDAEYNAGDDNVANFSVGTRFGAALLELGEAAGYEDLDSLVSDIAEVTQNNVEDIEGLITGKTEPEDELALYLAKCFELDDQLTLDLRMAAMEARGETLEDEDEESETNSDDGEEDAEYSQVEQLQSRLAEFEQSQQIRDALSELEHKAKEVMPPAALKVMFGDFKLESDRVAAFSQTAQLNQVDPEVELYAMQKTVELFEKAGLNKLAMFQSYSNNTASEVTNEDLEIENQAKRNFELRQARNHNLA
jgi:plasmid maintenance system antidote protein VapI